MLPKIMMHATMIVGTVMDDDRVRLQNVVMIQESRSKLNRSFGSRIPYVSRWGKNTGIGRVSPAVPGEVGIKWSEICETIELTQVEFDVVQRNGGGFERFGVRRIAAIQCPELPASVRRLGPPCSRCPLR